MNVIGPGGRTGSDVAAAGEAAIVLRADPYHRAVTAYGRDVAVSLAAKMMASVRDQLKPTEFTMRSAFECFLTLTWNGSRSELDDLLRRMPAAQLVDLDGRPEVIGATMGVAVRRDLPIAEPGDGLMAYADAALCTALRRRYKVAYADSSMLDTIRAEMDMVRRLRVSGDDSFFVVYQPLVELGDLQVRGFESLLRWRTPDGVVSPDAFISVAESSSLIVPIGWHSIRQTIATLATDITPRFGSQTCVTVNLSGQQLLDTQIANYIGGLIEEYRVDPAQVWVEIRENQVISLDSSAAHAVEQLHDIGCRICIDDLGSGFSALSYVRDLPVDVLKVDRSLISNLVNDGYDRAVVEAICEMAKAMGIVTVAEGIESPEILAKVTALGFDIGQGYLFGRPDVPLVAFGGVA